MRQFTSSLAICLLVGIAGCVGSLNPLYTTKTAIDDDRIVGTWVAYDPVFQKHGPSTYVITENGRKAYTAIYKGNQDDTDIEFDLHLVAVGDMTFWDCHPPRTEDDHAFLDSRVRLHSFVRYEFKDDKIQLFGCELRKFEWLLVSEKVPFVKKDNRIVITATTTELHDFLAKHGKAIFSADHTSIFNRKTDEDD